METLVCVYRKLYTVLWVNSSKIKTGTLQFFFEHPNNTPNGRGSENYNPEEHNPEFTLPRMDIIRNGHYPEWTLSQMETISN